MWTRRYANFEGEYKLLSQSGVDEYFSLLGFPASVLAAIKADKSPQRMVISEREGYFHIVHASVNGPKRQTVFRFDEEFDFEMPGLGDTFKAIQTLQGKDTWVSVFKGPKATLSTTSKFTKNFMIVVSKAFL
jgi:hypothetical protein